MYSKALIVNSKALYSISPVMGKFISRGPPSTKKLPVDVLHSLFWS